METLSKKIILALFIVAVVWLNFGRTNYKVPNYGVPNARKNGFIWVPRPEAAGSSRNKLRINTMWYSFKIPIH